MSGEVQCRHPAVFRYTWPGKDEAVACMEHGVQLARVAHGMGFKMQLIPMSFKVGDVLPDPWPTCSSFVKEQPDG